MKISGVERDFAECDQSNPNCVIMGDAEHDFTYENMNAAFRVLLGSEEKLLISLGCKWVTPAIYHSLSQSHFVVILVASTNVLTAPVSTWAALRWR